MWSSLYVMLVMARVGFNEWSYLDRWSWMSTLCQNKSKPFSSIHRYGTLKVQIA